MRDAVEFDGKEMWLARHIRSWAEQWIAEIRGLGSLTMTSIGTAFSRCLGTLVNELGDGDGRASTAPGAYTQNDAATFTDWHRPDLGNISPQDEYVDARWSNL